MDAYDKFWQQLEDNNFDKNVLAEMIKTCNCPYLHHKLEDEESKKVIRKIKINETKNN